MVFVGDDSLFQKCCKGNKTLLLMPGSLCGLVPNQSMFPQYPLDISILPRPSQTRSEPFHEKPVLIRFQVVERVFERLQHDWIHNVVQPTREHKYDQQLQPHQASTRENSIAINEIIEAKVFQLCVRGNNCDRFFLLPIKPELAIRSSINKKSR